MKGNKFAYIIQTATERIMAVTWDYLTCTAVQPSLFSEVKQTFMKEWEYNAGGKCTQQSPCSILLPSDAFYYLHPVQVGLLEGPMKLEVLIKAKTHAQLNKLQYC